MRQSPRNSPEQRAMIEYVLEGMQHKMLDVAQANLAKPLSEEEVVDALAGVCRTSCLGSYGLSRDFFENIWDMIKENLVDGLKEAWDVGYLPLQFQEGMKFLIPKVQGIVDNRFFQRFTSRPQPR